MVAIDYSIPPFTRNIFDDLVSTRCSLFWKNFFLADCPIGLSSFLQGNPRGRVVTLLINFGVISMERPLKLIVAWVLK